MTPPPMMTTRAELGMDGAVLPADAVDINYLPASELWFRFARLGCVASGHAPPAEARLEACAGVARASAQTSHVRQAHMGPSVRRDALIIGRIAIDTVDAVLLVENISRSRQNPGGVGG
jgi:hypothetical protein